MSGRSILCGQYALPGKVLEISGGVAYAWDMPASRPEPIEIHAHAMDNLRYIRQTMERAGSFTAVPGVGKFVAGFTPAMIAGAVISLALMRAGFGAFLPGVWLLLYGVAVVSGGWASVRVVPMMGACFMAAGVAALLIPGLPANLMLAAGFGGIHIVFGTVIATNYGG